MILRLALDGVMTSLLTQHFFQRENVVLQAKVLDCDNDPTVFLQRSVTTGITCE